MHMARCHTLSQKWVTRNTQLTAAHTVGARFPLISHIQCSISTERGQEVNLGLQEKVGENKVMHRLPGNTQTEIFLYLD